jgi:hypothetical protein
MIQTSERPEKRRQKRATRYRRGEADARIVHIPVKSKSKAGIEYTRYKPQLQRIKA